MTKLAELKKRLMKNPGFRKEYEKTDAEYATIETTLRRYAAATGTRLHMELLPEDGSGQ